MTVQHADGTTCMADFWEQSAKLLQQRVEEYERIIESLWPLIPPQEPSPELYERIVALIGGMTNTQAAKPEEK